MSENSSIEWTDSTWNPIRARRLDTGKVGWHCVKVSEECDNCYAAAMNLRCNAEGTKGIGTGHPYHQTSEPLIEIFLDQEVLEAPLKWKRPRKIFVCSMTDLFGHFVPGQMIDQVYAMMALANWHTYQVLTKRPSARLLWATKERATTAFFGSKPFAKDQVFNWAVNHWAWKEQPFRWPLPNVWEGVTAGTQRRLEQRGPTLAETPAAIRFISYEPALGPLDFGAVAGPVHFLRTIDWVISGSESGTRRRPSELDWFRSVARQCELSGVAHFHKQRWVEGHLVSLPEIDGRIYAEFPRVAW